jgi:chitin disaccharide deacetylase
MLIINADDFGRSQLATDRILSCFQHGRLTSASAMVFMSDSERAASLAKDVGLDTGLHLNFTQPFTHGDNRANRSQEKIVRFLNKNKYSFLLYNPTLRQQFRDLVRIQMDQFQQLYGSAPTHFDGHHHMHLCLNMLFDEIIPRGSKVRRNFSFARGEKNFVNRLYRSLIDAWLTRRYRCTDYLFSLSASLHCDGLQRVAQHSLASTVELQTHPENTAEFDWLMSAVWEEIISPLRRGSFANL